MTALIAAVAAIYVLVGGWVWALCAVAARGDRAVEECAS